MGLVSILVLFSLTIVKQGSLQLEFASNQLGMKVFISTEYDYIIDIDAKGVRNDGFGSNYR